MNRPLALGLTGVLVLAGLAVVSLSRPPEPTKTVSRGPAPAAYAAPALPPPSEVGQQDPAPAVTARDVVGSNWNSPTPTVFAEFRDWSARYLAASPAARPALVAEGLTRAKARRLAMAVLIQDDPENALALAVPMVVRQQLPAGIVAQLEERISGRGELALIGMTPIEGQPANQSIYRSALIGRDEYTAFVYGRRLTQTTLPATSLVGVALDGRLAVSESPLRVLESGELAAGRPVSNICDVSGQSTGSDAAAPFNVSASTAVEYNGTVHVLCSAPHVADLEKQLEARENAAPGGSDEGEVASSITIGRPSTTWTQGSKKLLIIRVDFSDLPGAPLRYGSSTPIDIDYTVNVINNANGVRDFYVKNSFGKTTLVVAPVVAGRSADATPVLRVPQTASYYAVNYSNSLLHSDARAAALAAGYNSANYDRVAVVFTYLGNLPSSQMNYAGLGQVTGKNFWVNGSYDLRVVAHELGHTYGLYHANLWQVSDGNAVSAAGSSTEYGDRFDVMGNGGGYQYDFSHWNKNILQWIPDTSVLTATTGGTYRVYRFDGVQAANLANPRVLKVARDATRDFWIGYRRGSGNASLNGGAYIVWGSQYNAAGNLLDMTTPGTNPGGTQDPGLAIGASFYDPVSGVTLRPVAQGGSGTEEYLDVVISFLPPTVFGDLNGDAKSDIVLTNTVTGERAAWLMNGAVLSSGVGIGLLSPNWMFNAIGDFNADGKSDIFLTNSVTGERAIWLMNGAAIGSGGSLGILSTNWSISGTGDFNGDGKSDVLLSNTVTGDRAIWLMSGTTITAGAHIGAISLNWTFNGSGDFNGDGKSDILMTNTVTGDRAIWLMNGTTITTGAYIAALPTTWSFSGTGDFNGDGKGDILLTNTLSGGRAIWLMNGTTISTGTYIGVLAPSWTFSRIGDFNGNGTSDIFLTNSVTGERAVWLMNGTVIASGISLGITSTNWAITR